MKSFALVLFVAQALALQNTYAQVIRSLGPNIAGPIISSPYGCGSPCGSPLITSPSVIAAPSVVAAPSVANSLADTLSLLTVSSLLAETLPMGYPVVSAPVGGCGCGYSNYYY